MTLSDEDLEYFKRGEMENPRFFARLGGEPSFEGKRVLDVGCGHGSLCVYIAERGAGQVLGVDIDERRIGFAAENLGTNYRHLSDICEFRACDVANVAENDFDIIVCKDSFEHIVDLDECLACIAERLKPGGRLYAGFGPLYCSPFGDHRRLGLRFPWSHVIIPENLLLRRLRRKSKRPIESVYDLGLNKLKTADFLRLFRESGLCVEFFGVNVSKNPLSKLFTLISKIPPLKEYFSHNLYCVLRRPERMCVARSGGDGKLNTEVTGDCQSCGAE